MILSERRYPFGTIITRMSDGRQEFVVSTAKESLFKGLTTIVQYPVGNNAVKILYAPAMVKRVIHSVHKNGIDYIEQCLKSGMNIQLIIRGLMELVIEDGYADRVIVADGFNVSSARSKKCPSCNAAPLKLTPGKRNRCPQCQYIFMVDLK